VLTVASLAAAGLYTLRARNSHHSVFERSSTGSREENASNQETKARF
jgi:hypothetical protein